MQRARRRRHACCLRAIFQSLLVHAESKERLISFVSSRRENFHAENTWNSTCERERHTNKVSASLDPVALHSSWLVLRPICNQYRGKTADASRSGHPSRLTSHSPNRFYPQCARTQCRSFRTLLDIFQCTMEAAEAEFFHHFYLRRISLASVAGALSTLERSKINRRPPAVLFLILKRALSVLNGGAHWATLRKVVCPNSLKRWLTIHVALAHSTFCTPQNHCWPLQVHCLQTLPNGSENLQK